MKTVEKKKPTSIIKDEVMTERGTKLYIIERPPVQVNIDSETDIIAKDLSDKSDAATTVGTRFIDVVETTRSLLTMNQSQGEGVTDIMGFDEVIANTKDNLLDGIEDKVYLRTAVLPLEMLQEARNE